MKPKKVTIEEVRAVERADRQKALCDEIIHRAALMMANEVRAPMPMVLDRILTFAAVQAVSTDGEPSAAAAFRDLADWIDAGACSLEAGQ